MWSYYIMFNHNHHNFLIGVQGWHSGESTRLIRVFLFWILRIDRFFQGIDTTSTLYRVYTSYTINRYSEVTLMGLMGIFSLKWFWLAT